MGVSEVASGHGRDVWCHRTSSYEKPSRPCGGVADLIRKSINRVSTLISGSSLHTQRLATEAAHCLHNGNAYWQDPFLAPLSPNVHLSCCESNESSSNGARPSRVVLYECLCLIMARDVSHGQPVLKTPLGRWAAICSPCWFLVF